MGQRDKRALGLLAAAVALFALLQTDFLLPSSAGGASSSDTLQVLEQRLELAKARAARKPLTEAELASAKRSLASLEGRLLEAADPALAQAEMRSLVGDLLAAEGVAMSGSQFGQPALERDEYATVPLTVEFTCGIEQLVNLMASVANSPRLLTTRFLRVRPEKPDVKSIAVRMTLAGYLPLERAPELAAKIRDGGRQ
jgi:Tfp pilus assembly protein PilO